MEGHSVQKSFAARRNKTLRGTSFEFGGFVGFNNALFYSIIMLGPLMQEGTGTFWQNEAKNLQKIAAVRRKRIQNSAETLKQRKTVRCIVVQAAT